MFVSIYSCAPVLKRIALCRIYHAPVELTYTIPFKLNVHIINEWQGLLNIYMYMWTHYVRYLSCDSWIYIAFLARLMLAHINFRMCNTHLGPPSTLLVKHFMRTTKYFVCATLFKDRQVLCMFNTPYGPPTTLHVQHSLRTTKYFVYSTLHKDHQLLCMCNTP